MDFISGHVLFFDCDQRGRNTHHDGFKNSRNGFERPFIVLSDAALNRQWGNDGMYALPLTTRQDETDTFSITLDQSSFENGECKGFAGSRALCSKICRISASDLQKRPAAVIAKLTYSSRKQLCKNVKTFLDAHVL